MKRVVGIQLASALSLFLVSLVAGPGVAGAVTTQDLLTKEKKLEDVRKHIRDEKESVKAISRKETSILGELDGINRRLTARREEVIRVKAKVAKTRGDLKRTDSRIRTLEKEHKALEGRLKSRMRAMYKMRRGETLKVLFSPGTSEDLGRRHKYLSIVMESDSKLIARYEDKLTRLESEKARLKVLKDDLEAARGEAVRKKKEAQKVYARRRALLRNVRNEKGRRKRVVRELEQAARDLSALLGKLRTEESYPASGFAAMKGSLSMPVSGKVRSRYGKVRHPRFKTITFNNGITIDAPVGASVKNVYDGKVIYVGWLKGYGKVMIIDHGGGFYTLFAHLSSVLKLRGDKVVKGDEVGLVGDTGVGARAGLYFEIRQRGIPRDPMDWLAKR